MNPIDKLLNFVRSLYNQNGQNLQQNDSSLVADYNALVDNVNILLFVSDFERGYYPKQSTASVSRVDQLLNDNGVVFCPVNDAESNMDKLFNALSAKLFKDAGEIKALFLLSSAEINKLLDEKLEEIRRENETPEETEKRRISELRGRYTQYEVIEPGTQLDAYRKARFGFVLETAEGRLNVFVGNKETFLYCEILSNQDLNNFPFVQRLNRIISDSQNIRAGYIYEKYDLNEYDYAYDKLEEVMIEFVKYQKENIV